jgi:hypothetical protein
VILRKVALGLVATSLLLIGTVFLMIAVYQGLRVIAPPGAAALGVAALALGAGGGLVALIASAPSAPPPAPAAAANLTGTASPLLSIVRLSLLPRLLRARPLTIMAAALVGGALAAWGTRDPRPMARRDQPRE